MTYEVVRAGFRTELHLRWSVFFDHLEIPYAYEPTAFHDVDGAGCTPAFWLPQHRIWFHAEPVAAPSWWERFACCAIGDDVGASWSGMFEDCEDLSGGVDFVPFHVDEHWQGQALLHLGGIPGDDPGAPGPWSDHAHAGLYTHNDALYRWTVCRECGLFGAQYGGYADRLACGCRDGHKDDNSSDPRLLDAYRSARDLLTSLSATSCDADSAGRLVRRESLVDQQGMAAALDRCIGQCFSLDEQLRADLPVGAFAESTQDADVLCGQCPGFVCAECAMRPAPALGEHCQVCRPRVQITYRRARQLLNTQAAQVGAAAQRSAREVNTLLNQAAQRGNRAQFTLADLGRALDLAQLWLDSPHTMPDLPPDPSCVPEDQVTTMGANALCGALNRCVGRLVAASGAQFAAVQTMLTQTTGAARRAEADEEALRDALVMAQRWIKDPRAFHEFFAPASRRKRRPDYAGIPEPVRTCAAPCNTVCGLCTDPVAVGETVGRLPHRGGDRYAVMGWLCAHCLRDRRLRPRRQDLVLRIFHHMIPGAPVALNRKEAEVLSDWLAEQSATDPEEPALLDTARDVLRGLQDSDLTVTELPFKPAEAVISALCSNPQPSAQAVGRRGDALLHAVAHHVMEWRDNPRQLVADHYERRSLWRLAIMQHSDQLTPLTGFAAPFSL